MKKKAPDIGYLLARMRSGSVMSGYPLPRKAMLTDHPMRIQKLDMSGWDLVSRTSDGWHSTKPWLWEHGVDKGVKSL